MSLTIFKGMMITLIIIGFLLISISFLSDDNDDRLTSLALKIKKKGFEKIDDDKVRPYNILYKVIIPVFVLLTVYIPLSLFVQLLYWIFVKMIYNKLPNVIKSFFGFIISFFEFIISFIIYTYFLCFYYFVKIICCCARDDAFFANYVTTLQKRFERILFSKTFQFQKLHLENKDRCKEICL